MPSRPGSGPLFGTLAPILIAFETPDPVGVIEGARHETDTAGRLVPRLNHKPTAGVKRATGSPFTPSVVPVARG